MDRSVRALESFCEDDEEWVDSWTVDVIGRGWKVAPSPSASDRTVGLTDRRLLWLDGELESVTVADVESVTTDVIERRNAPPVVRIGAIAMVLGIAASVASTVLLSVPLTTAVLPFAVGLLAFVATIAVARVRESPVTEHVHHRLKIDTDDGVVSVWDDEATLTSIADALETAAES